MGHPSFCSEMRKGLMADFLFEIGLEEVPARMLAGAEAELRERVVKMLQRERLVSGDVVAVGYSTPRRLAVRVRDVAERQGNVVEEMMGPAVKIAYKDGQPGPAAVAFAKKTGVSVDALKIVDTPKGKYVAATAIKAGRGASEVIAAELPKELAGIYWAKNMYWRAGKPEKFVRPVRWMVALLDEQVVPVEFGGYAAGRVDVRAPGAAWGGAGGGDAGGLCRLTAGGLGGGKGGGAAAHDPQGAG